MLLIIFHMFLIWFTSECSSSMLPKCLRNSPAGFVVVSTLDGKISVLDSNGSLLWNFDTGPDPLLLSNTHDLELTTNGEQIRIIPSLNGNIFKFDGSFIDPIPLNTEDLWKSSFLYSGDMAIALAIEIRTYRLGLKTGTMFYACIALNCLNNANEGDEEDILLVERTTRTLKAMDRRTGVEKWSISVGLHNIKLPKDNCNREPLNLSWNFSAIIPEGKLFTSVKLNDKEERWQYIFSSPIVKMWQWNGTNLSDVNIFALQNTQEIPTTLPSLYLGMHNKQFYIYESQRIQDLIKAKLNSDIFVQSTDKIPWKPINASDGNIENKASSLSVLTGSEYPNDQGFYFYTQSQLKTEDTVFCKTTVIHFLGSEFSSNICWKDTTHYIEIVIFIIIISIVFYTLVAFWLQHQNSKNIITENTLKAEIVTDVVHELFSSRFQNDFETIRCLGKGGFGIVFEVKQKYDEHKYAIKRITLPQKEQSRDRVMREVKALAKLEHPNIVRYFGSWVENPPIGWQQNHDEKWITQEESSYITDTYFTNQKITRSKSISVISSSYGEGIHKSQNDSDIVFEHNESNQIDNKTQGDESNNLSNHIEKKINWKKRGTQHLSWDISSSRSLDSKQSISPIYLYIQMQLCREQSLKEWLTINKDRNYQKVVKFFTQILKAVEYIHKKGLIHRDLKPSNIFFSLDGQIKVGDFGLVKDAFGLEIIKKGSKFNYGSHSVEVGTQLYMSPEQFKSKYDNKVDIYALGLILFEMLNYFSTEMERIKILTGVKNNCYPEEFTIAYPHDFFLLQNMLCENPNARFSLKEIKNFRKIL